jgi:deoxyguanosine kinase
VIIHDPSPAVQKRGREVHAVFSTEHHARGDISESEVALLDTIGADADRLLETPNLLMYLDAPVEELARRIRSRGRTEERAVDTGYLERMDGRYRAFVGA